MESKKLFHQYYHSGLFIILFKLLLTYETVTKSCDTINQMKTLQPQNFSQGATC